MAEQLYFSRDTKVYVQIGANIWEMPVLDGYSFSQATNASEITLNEMSDENGNSRRARQMFTDSYAPAEWSFSTYARPFVSDGSAGAAGHHHAVEEVLWALMVGDASYSSPTAGGTVATISGAVVPTTDADLIPFAGTYEIATSTDGNGSGATLNVTISGAGAVTVALNNGGTGYDVGDKLFIAAEDLAIASGASIGDINADIEATVATITTATGTSFTGFTRDATDLNISFAQSNKTVLGTADIFFVMGGAQTGGTKKVYKIEGCCVNEASLDFDIDGIAMINWSGFGKIITEAAEPTATITEAVTSTSNFIRNRLTNLEISSSLPTTTTYNLVLTGGNVTISNNLTFLTPETLGVVNQPLGHVTGTRSVSGSFTCYLNADTNSSADLFNNIISGTTTITNDFALTFNVGGATGTPRIELAMSNCHLEVPSHSIEDVISLETNFHALPSTISGTDELTILYKGE